MIVIGETREPSSIPPFPLSSSVGSASAIVSGSGSVSIGPRVHASKLDSYIFICATPDSQPSLKSTDWNKDKHDAAKMQLETFGSIATFYSKQPSNFFYIYSLSLYLLNFYIKGMANSNLNSPIYNTYFILFIYVRSPYWQNMVDPIIVCGARFKAPNDEEIKDPILSQKMVDVKATIEEQQEIWRKKDCTIMTNGWMGRRNKTLLNLIVSS